MIPYDVMRLSASLCHFWQCCLEIGSGERKGWDGGGGWVQLQGSAVEAKALVGTGWPISALLA